MRDVEARLVALERALDTALVCAHLGVFNPGDDPEAALNQLLAWYADVGAYFERQRILELTRYQAVAYPEYDRNGYQHDVTVAVEPCPNGPLLRVADITPPHAPG
jgi:hypothetical protein